MRVDRFLENLILKCSDFNNKCPVLQISVCFESFLNVTMADVIDDVTCDVTPTKIERYYSFLNMCKVATQTAAYLC